MLTLIHSDGRSWPVSDAFALLAELSDPELHALLDLARAQSKLDAATTGAIAHPFPCRHRREATVRDQPPPSCRWASDPAGGFACLQCGTWAQPDSERARLIGIASKQEDGRGAIAMTCAAIISLAWARASETGWRPGQALFNLLTELLPELAAEIRGTESDPFHAGPHNNRWANAIAAIEQHLARAAVESDAASEVDPA